jgi:hypothetical protein
LQIERALRLLGNCLEIGTQRRFCNCFRIIVVVLPTLVEKLHVDPGMIRGSNPILRSATTNKLGTQASFHPNDTSPEILKDLLKLMAFDLLAQHPIAAGIKPNQVENVPAGIHANGHQFIDLCFLGTHGYFSLFAGETVQV